MWFACVPQPPFADSTPSHICDSTSTFPSLSPILNKNNKYSFIPGYTFSAGVHINIKVEGLRKRFTHININKCPVHQIVDNDCRKSNKLTLPGGEYSEAQRKHLSQ